MTWTGWRDKWISVLSRYSPEREKALAEYRIMVASGQRTIEVLAKRLALQDAEIKRLQREVDVLTEQERDWEEKLRVAEAERTVFVELAGLKEVDLAEAKILVHQMQSEEANWRKTATRETILAHYDCALSNWSVSLNQRDNLHAQLLNLTLDRKRGELDA